MCSSTIVKRRQILPKFIMYIYSYIIIAQNEVFKESNPQANHDSGGFSKWETKCIKKKGQTCNMQMLYMISHSKFGMGSK
jgi:hypothetical protein